MSRVSSPRPTDAELAILRILWDRGPSTVRQVHDVLGRERPSAYTTALKLLQIMTEKGLVERDERDRTHVYRARLSEEHTQRQLVRDLVDRAFGGSAAKLVLQALTSKHASPAELREIRQILDSARGTSANGTERPEKRPSSEESLSEAPDGAERS
jgi:predicted transcriptional regulator